MMAPSLENGKLIYPRTVLPQKKQLNKVVVTYVGGCVGVNGT